MKVSLKNLRAQYVGNKQIYYVLGLRCWGPTWGIDGIRQMYLYVFVCYWFVMPLGEYICTNVLAYGSCQVCFHFQLHDVSVTLHLHIFFFARRCLAALSYVGLPVWDLGSCFFPILVVGT